MKQIIYTINVSKKPLMSAASSLMTEIMTVSRLKYKPDFIPMKSDCALPNYKDKFSKNFETVALERAEYLWKNESQDNKLSLLWSGGIDSTVALVASLITRPQSGTMDVYCNSNSIFENNFFYCKLLAQKNVNLLNSSIIQAEKPISMITGELGDQVFGSDLLFRIDSAFGFESLSKNYKEIIPKLFESRCGTFGTNLFERYQPIVHESPFEIKSAFDFVWWWNFTQKWQCVKYRKEGLINPVHKVIHFFENDDFQLWSINNHHLKISDSLTSYKMPAKNFIYKYDNNATYLKYKKKLGSPFGNKRYFYVLYDDGSKLYTWDECNKMIDQYTPEIPY